MDDGDAEHEPDNLSPSSRFTVIIRWWHESASGPGEEGRALRGTIRDVMGRTLGSFAGIESLFGLLRKIMANKPRRPH